MQKLKQKAVEEKGEYLDNLLGRQMFLRKSLESMNNKIKKLSFTKNKNSCLSKYTCKKINRQATNWKKIMQTIHLTKDLHAEHI